MRRFWSYPLSWLSLFLLQKRSNNEVADKLAKGKMEKQVLIVETFTS